MSTDQDQSMPGSEVVSQHKGDPGATTKTSKTQKKKAKKNATKAAAKETSKTELMQNLNPHNLLRNKLLAKGFTEKQIDDAMEEMWTRNLAYDDFDAVSEYLRGAGKDRDTPACGQNSEQTALLNPEEENTTTSTAASTIAAAITPPSEGDFVLGFSPVEEEKDGDYDSSANSRRGSNGGANSQAPSLAVKLEMVARYENLVDAAFALTEWITKAAKSHEVEDLCNAEKSEALVIIFRRAVECNDQSMFDRAVLPGMLELIAKILETTGVSAAAVSATRKSFEGILRRSRSAALKSDDAVKFSVGAANLIISRIRNVVQESKYSVRDGNELIKKLEDEIQSLAPSSSSEQGIVELISKRDMHRTAAEKSSEVVKIAVIASNRSRGSRYAHREVELERADLLTSLLGEGGRANVDNVRAEQLQIAQELDAVKSGSGTEQLKSDLDSYKAERVAIADRMEELRKALKILEERDAILSITIEESQKQLTDLRHNQAVRVEELSQKLIEKNAAIAFGDSVELVVDSLQRFDETLEKSFASSVRSGATKARDMRDVAISKINVFLIRAKNYFAAEAECVDFLRGRVVGLEQEIKTMKLEIESCAMLGLGETVKQLTKKLETMQKHIFDDRDVITCLCGEAERMRDELVARVEQFIDAIGTKLSSVQTTVLSDIAPCFARIGLANLDRFTSLLQSSAADVVSESAGVVSGQSAETVDAAATPIVAEVAHQPAAAQKPAWGSSETEQKTLKSIRDIQQEELQSKE